MTESDLAPQRLGFIGGSGAYDLLADGTVTGRKLGPQETPYGLSSPIWEASFVEDAQPALFMSRHGETGYSISAPYVNYRANAYALKDAGVAHIVAWSGPGAIDDSLEIGQYVVPDDLIDETCGRASTFFEGKGHGFIRQNPVFCPELRALLMQAAGAIGRPASGGSTYVCTQGPRLETPAEIRKFALYGGQLVGMTLVPEAFLARELAMGYAAICYITNYAEGVRERPHVAGTLFEGLATPEETRAVRDAVADLPSVLRKVMEASATTAFACACHTSMDRFIRSGRVGPDWRSWL